MPDENLDPKCRYCKRPKSEHESTSQGLQCRAVQFFAPCEHKNRQGCGSMGSDGKVKGESTCMDCFEVFTW